MCFIYVAYVSNGMFNIIVVTIVIKNIKKFLEKKEMKRTNGLFVLNVERNIELLDEIINGDYVKNA